LTKFAFAGFQRFLTLLAMLDMYGAALFIV
jgi:hypothetical protein